MGNLQTILHVYNAEAEQMSRSIPIKVIWDYLEVSFA